ncbi:MAG: glycosyltransferase [Pseudolabrys sp.]|jgi:glycosyltransferase involved in cell wall biosynthesis
MLCLIHGYALSGSGSNLWTRAVAQALCRSGETVHIVCQDRRPEQHDFVAAAYQYETDGTRQTLFEKTTPYAGRAILHRPQLNLLPVYVRPAAGVKSMVSILDLPDSEIQIYLDLNERVLLRVVCENDVSAMHVNHVVLMSVVARRVSLRTGVPYAVMPHGSALEYVVRHDTRMQAMAMEALEGANRIVVLSDELAGRVHEVLPNIRDFERKLTRTNVGVNTDEFRLVDRSERRESIGRLGATIAGMERGKRAGQSEYLAQHLRDGLSKEEVRELLVASADYLTLAPDEDTEAKLQWIDWGRDRVVAYVGNLIGFKGVPALMAAFPVVLQSSPHARLLVVGRGRLRELLEAFLVAMARGQRRLCRHLMEWGDALEGESQVPFLPVTLYFDRLDREGRLDAWFDAASQLLDPGHVVFTGHLEHNALCHLYPCCDVAVFPSIVAEAGPLVLIEAMASGCYPIGTYFAGMGANIDIAASALDPQQGRYMRLRRDPKHLVDDIAANIVGALGLNGSYRSALREVAVANYDWKRIAHDLSRALHAMAGEQVRSRG